VEDVLGRRLQTLVFKKGMAVSPLHARQLIAHGHVLVGERAITIPGYGVSRNEEGHIRLSGAKAPERPAAPEVEAQVPKHETQAVAPE
jgi:ribosomal protein S4